MFNFKTFNNIAEDGLEILRENNFQEVPENPDGLLLRSHALTEEDFGENLKCVARAGSGTNNIREQNGCCRGGLGQSYTVREAG